MLAELEFLVQGKLLVGDEGDGDAALSCPNCSYIQESPRDWLRERAGDWLGCPGCGIPARIPSLEL